MTDDKKALPTIGIGWQLGPTHGWGIHGLELARRLGERELAQVVPFSPELRCPIIHAGHNHLAQGNSYTPKANDRLIHVFEDVTAVKEDLAFLKAFDGRIITVSQWCADLLNAPSVAPQFVLGEHVRCVHLGVDTKLFKPRSRKYHWGGDKREDTFVVFSGGKAELRKGHDIVLAAFKIFHERHPDSMLVTMWHNHWPVTMESLSRSPYLDCPTIKDVNGMVANSAHDFTIWSQHNGIPKGSHIDLGLTRREMLADLMCTFDVALFPNRCEGGTNMVAMECLAAGVPTILSANTGHLDLINDPVPCYQLEKQTHKSYGLGTDMWRDSDVDEIVEGLEYIYQHRGEAVKTGILAAEQLDAKWNWDVRMDEQIEALGLDKLREQDEPLETLRAAIAALPPKEAAPVAQAAAPYVKPDAPINGKGAVKALAGAVAAAPTAAADMKRGMAHQFSELSYKLRDLGFIKAALALSDRAMAIDPTSAMAVGNAAGVALVAHDTQKAKEYSEKAMKLAPGLTPYATHTLGTTLMYAGQLEAAIRELDKVKGKFVDAAFDRACALMLLGRWREGWEAMEIRRVRFPEHHAKYDGMKEWDGKDMDGTLWVTCEQGLGDTIMMSRYLPWARTMCDRLVFSVPAVLMPMFYGFPGIDELRLWETATPTPKADAHVPLVSLGYYWDRHVDVKSPWPPSVPEDPGHFKKHAESIRGEMVAAPDTLKVGIVWAGSKIHPKDYERSIALERLLCLAANPNVTLFSFQVGKRSGDIERCGASSMVVDLDATLTNWTATAAGLKQLDLLITVDTSVAHMAGALGVPTWIMLCKLPDWRWLHKGDSTVWYPSVRLFRQKKLGDWDDVIERVCSALKVKTKGM